MTSSSKKAQGYDGPIRVLACKWVRSIDVSKDSSAMKVIDKKKTHIRGRVRYDSIRNAPFVVIPHILTSL